MKSIATIIHHKNFPLKIVDSNGNYIYFEYLDGYWSRTEYDDNGNEIYWENSGGHWTITKYDDKGNQIYYDSSRGKMRDRR